MKKVLNGLMLLLLVLSLGAYKKASVEVIEAKGQIVSLKSANANLVYEIENYPVKEVYELAEEIYGIEAELLEAIERLETGHYTSDVYKAKNNTWGARYNGEYKSFDSHKQSTLELARCLRFNYLNEGLTTLTEIGARYCPNDPKWASKVNSIYLELMQ
jgi:hypothetical protein